MMSALGLYIVPSFVLSILSCGIWILLRLNAQHTTLRTSIFILRLTITAAAALAVSLLLYSPAIISQNFEALVNNEVVSGAGVGMLAAVQQAGAILSNWTMATPLMLLVVVVVGLFAFLFVGEWRNVSLLFALFLTFILIGLVQGTFGPARVWVFALPLVLGFAAQGFVLLIKGKYVYPAAAIASILLILVFITGHILGNKDMRYVEFGSFPNAEKFVAKLAAEIRPSDGLLTHFPANRTINYYADRQNVLPLITEARHNLRLEKVRRVFVVVPNGKTTASVLRVNETQYEHKFSSMSYEVIAQSSIGDDKLVLLVFE